MPNFLAIESEDFNPETYVAPPFSTASTSLCWRYDPEVGEELQSNARIIRWSDGSLTLQLASNPTEQYRIASKPLARSNNALKTGDYDSELDSHVYFAAAAEALNIIRLTSHVTSSLTVLPTTVETDDAVQRLQESLAAATRSSNKNPDGTVTIVNTIADPELAKKQAEQAEREKLREARKRQMAAEREMDRGRRVGIHARTGGAGLTIAGLEGEDDAMASRGRGARKAKRRTNRRGEIYSDDEDEYDRRGQTRQDEYDEDDGFLVRSDEEVEMASESGGEDDLLDEDMDAEGESDDEVRPAKPAATRERQQSPLKRPAEETPQAAEPGKTSASPPTRKKHRYIVDDDEDE
jgi:RNA polymerase-associated protein LEO1